MIHLRVRQLRLQRPYSEEYMAERLGISQSAYSRIEKGKTKLDVLRLRQIAEILNVTLEVLLMPFPDRVQPGAEKPGGAQPSGEARAQALLARLVDLYAEQIGELQEVNARYARMTVRILALLEKSEG